MLAIKNILAYTYGNFTYAKQEIKKVALKALYKLRKEMGDHFRDDVQLTMKIFDTVISPILTYGSEVWGVDHDGKLENDPIEFVQTKFIRWLLGVNKFRSSNACRSEVGRFPMRKKTKCRAIKYWLKFCEPEHQNKLSGIAFTDQIGLITVFDAILTGRQVGVKLQCLYENPMSNNFRKTSVLKKL